jgi:hypothetical protein
MKRKKKSKLQKKIDDPNSRLWRNKADKLWRELVVLYWKSRCAICGAVENIQAHHMIPREMYSHRHIVRNGIILCASHHKYSFELSPHKAPVAFFKWLREHAAGLLEWALEQTPSRKNERTFREIATELEETLKKMQPKTETPGEPAPGVP